MSMTVSLLHEVSTAVSAVPVPTAPAAEGGGEGILGWLNSKISEATTTTKAAGGLVAVLIALIGGWRARGALGGLCSAGVVAMLFFWVVNNVDNDQIKDRVDEEVTKGAPAPGTHQPPPDFPLTS